MEYQELTFDQYQDLARETAVYPEEYKGMYPLLGLIGETGELAEKFKDLLSGDDGICSGVIDQAIAAGKVAERVKKILRDQSDAALHAAVSPLRLDPGKMNPEAMAALEKEQGDTLWYSAACCSDLGIRMGEVAAKNYAKLKSRHDRGKVKGSGDDR